MDINEKYLIIIAVVTTWCLFTMAPGTVRADLVFDGSGTGTAGDPISATATFDFVDYNFGNGFEAAVKITLTNTGADTNYRGNLVTGLFWSLSDDSVLGSVGNLTTTSSGFDGIAAEVHTDTDGTTDLTNVDIAPAVNNTSTDGTYQLSNGTFGTANDGNDYSGFDYGIATVGMGLTGFQGSVVGGDNYGIIAAGTDDLTADGLGSVGDIIDTSAMFWIARPEAWTSLDQLGNSVRITYGSLPDNFITASVPEPSIELLLGISLIGLVGFGAVRKIKQKAVVNS